MKIQPIDDHSLRAPAWSEVAALLRHITNARPELPSPEDWDSELTLWTRPLGGHPAGMSVGWWVGWWAVQRPLQLQAMEEGYTIPGVDVLRAVAEVSEEAGQDPVVSYGSTDTEDFECPQVRVRYDWPGYEPLIFIRAPKRASETHLGMALVVDMWTQIDPLEDTTRPAEGRDAEQLATWRPGQFHDGTPRRIQDPEIRAMEHAFGQALANPQPANAPAPAAEWRDPKAIGHEASKLPVSSVVLEHDSGLRLDGAPLSAAAAPPEEPPDPPRPPRCPVCLREGITPVRFGRCADCERLIDAGNVWGLPQPPEGAEIRKLGDECYWARIKALKEAKQRRTELGMPAPEKLLADADKAEKKGPAGAREPARRVKVDGAEATGDAARDAGGGQAGPGRGGEVGPGPAAGDGDVEAGGGLPAGEGGGQPGAADVDDEQAGEGEGEGEGEADSETVTEPARATSASPFPELPQIVQVSCGKCSSSLGQMPRSVAIEEVRSGKGCACGAKVPELQVRDTATGAVVTGDALAREAPEWRPHPTQLVAKGTRVGTVHGEPFDVDGKLRVLVGWDAEGVEQNVDVAELRPWHPGATTEPAPAKKPKAPKVDHKPDLAFRLQSGGRCEWNPTDDAPAGIKKPGNCAKPATLIVGAKDAFKVCATCADRPFFARKRNRIPVPGATKR